MIEQEKNILPERSVIIPEATQIIAWSTDVPMFEEDEIKKEPKMFLSDPRVQEVQRYYQVLECITQEYEGSVKKFPTNKHKLAAATEELGELAQALIDYDRGKRSSLDVFTEAIQVASCAIRIALQGSEEFKYKYAEILHEEFVPTGGVVECDECEDGIIEEVGYCNCEKGTMAFNEDSGIKAEKREIDRQKETLVSLMCRVWGFGLDDREEIMLKFTLPDLSDFGPKDRQIEGFRYIFLHHSLEYIQKIVGVHDSEVE